MIWMHVTGWIWFQVEIFLTWVDSQFPLSSMARRHWKLRVNLQSWTKVLGTVLQYSYFSVISWFPHKTVHLFRNFLAVLSPPTLYKVETWEKILDTLVQHFLLGEGRGWTCVNWKIPQKCRSVPRLLSMIVG